MSKSSDILLSPPRVDENGAYGRDFYWLAVGHGRIRKLDTLTPITEVQYHDQPDWPLATFKGNDEFNHVYMVDSITFSPEEAIMAGRLMAKMQNQKVESGRD